MEGKQYKKRAAILECLRSTRQHPSAEMVHEMLKSSHPDISLATVYRNLSRFREQGLIQSVGSVGGAERFDAEIRPHVHFVCSGCASVLDLDVEIPPQLGQDAENRSGCQVQGCQLTFTGLCGQCQTH